MTDLKEVTLKNFKVQNIEITEVFAQMGTKNRKTFGVLLRKSYYEDKKIQDSKEFSFK